MDFNDATALMRLVQAVENDPYVSSGAGEALADKVREFIEDEAELGGWYTELMNAIGEGEITDPLADFTVGRFRVHLVQEGERYGATGGFVYGKALSNGSFGIPINDCQLYGHGLPLVEFYDVSQDPAKFPEGQLIPRYYMSTLLGMGSVGDSIGEMSALDLDGGVPNWTISGDDLQEVYAHLCAARESLQPQVRVEHEAMAFEKETAVPKKDLYLICNAVRGELEQQRIPTFDRPDGEIGFLVDIKYKKQTVDAVEKYSPGHEPRDLGIEFIKPNLYKEEPELHMTPSELHVPSRMARENDDRQRPSLSDMAAEARAASAAIGINMAPRFVREGDAR